MMSTDRIDFTLTCNHRELEATARAAARAFGISEKEARCALSKNGFDGTRMRCRPSQFGRFIVFRVEEGVECNRIKELKPKIIGCPPSQILDVSQNPK